MPTPANSYAQQLRDMIDQISETPFHELDALFNRMAEVSDLAIKELAAARADALEQCVAELETCAPWLTKADMVEDIREMKDRL